MVELYDEAGTALFSFAPGHEKTFTVRFLHSWARSPVDETFQVTSGGGLMLKETVYEDFGAGLPHEPEPGRPRESMTVEDGKIYIRNIYRPVPNLQVRVGRWVAGHELIFNDTKVPFSSFAAPGSAVGFRIQNVRRYDLWKRNLWVGEAKLQ